MAIPIKKITEEEFEKIIDITRLELDFPPYVNYVKVKKLEDLPRKAAIYLLRSTNKYRARGEVDEYVKNVLTMTNEKAIKDFPCILDILECFYPERREEIDKIKKDLNMSLKGVTTDIGDLYTIFSTLAGHLFLFFDDANYFSDELEYINLIGKTVFDIYPTEVDPKKIKKLEELSKKDAQRLIRVINSFRRKDIVDRFLSEIGDFESIYDLFQLYIGYVFHEYDNANYFLDEPELDPTNKEFQIKEFTIPTVFEGEFD